MNRAPAPTGERRCLRCLFCPAEFDAIGAINGTHRATGWRLSGVLDRYTCPEHAILWATGAHQPEYVMGDGRPAVIGCSCDWEATAGISAGLMIQEYITHALTALDQEFAR